MSLLCHLPNHQCVKILSVKPFNDAVDGVLFDWSKRHDRDILEDGEIMPNEVPQYVTLENREKVSNVLVRVVLEPREDPLSSLSALWEISLKGKAVISSQPSCQS